MQINQNYTSISTIDFDKAAVLLEDMKTINEIPVVTEQGDFLGIIRREKTQALRERQRKSLKASREYSWRHEEIRRFIKETKAAVFLYTYSREKAMECLDRKERQKIERHYFKKNQDGGNRWSALSSREWKKFLNVKKDNVADEMRKEQRDCRPVFVNGRAVFADMKGKYYTIMNGCRITQNQPPDADRRVFMFGPCLVFGAYCKDDQTIETYLQDLLNMNGYTSWKVINKGICGAVCYDQMFMEELSGDDIVVIVGDDQFIPQEAGNNIAFRGDLSEVFPQIPHLADCILDTISHCNYIVNKKYAQKIYVDLCSSGILKRQRRQDVPEKIQDYYIDWSLREYFMQYFQRYGLSKNLENSKTGAIVMNCNPFTKGHRYLIERALAVVDKLYIFVVEEDRSCFKFQDRLHMVEQGVSDLTGDIFVVPSGRYIISLDTFAQYFDKEYVQTIDSMDYDVYIFGEVVAATLGIQYRFVGEEPLDGVTRTYNETMKRILPKFDVKVVEIPRILFDEANVISATYARKAIQEGDMDMVVKLCPDSTIRYLNICTSDWGWSLNMPVAKEKNKCHHPRIQLPDMDQKIF